MTDTLEKGTPVIISGLQSEKGKKLNRGRGVVLNKPTTDDGVERYPVVIYALTNEDGGLVPLEETVRNKLKSQNLTVDTDKSEESQNFKDQAFYQQHTKALEANQGIPSKDSLLWASFIHHLIPENYIMSLQYANELSYYGRNDEAYEIAQRYVEDDMVKANKDMWNDLCYIFTRIYCRVGRVDEALEFAVQVPADVNDPMGKNVAYGSLMEVLDTCNRTILNGLGPEEKHPQTPLYLKTAKLAMERNSQDGMNMGHLAAAYCFSGQYLEGAKMYRKLLDSGSVVTPAKWRETEMNLARAQMQCEGMPWEGYYVIPYADAERAHAIHKDHLDKIAFSRGSDGKLKLTVIEDSPDGSNCLHIFEAPIGAGDPRFFSTEFLEKIGAS